MILSLKLKNTWKTICNFFKINPHRHWAFLLYLFFLFVIALVLFSFYLLYQIKNEQIFQVKIEAKQEKSLLKENLLKKTLNLFEVKNQKETDIKEHPSVYKDPSI